jgi:hypothetical protein
MMIWSTSKELQDVENAVEEHARSLREKLGEHDSGENDEEDEEILYKDFSTFAPGSTKDYQLHASYYIDLDEKSPISASPERGCKLSEHMSVSRFSKRKDVVDDQERDGKRSRTTKDSNGSPVT